MALRINGNMTAKLSPSNSGISGKLSNAVIKKGTTDYNELINKPEIPSVEGMVTSTVIKEIKVVDGLPDTEEPEVLYLVRVVNNHELK